VAGMEIHTIVINAVITVFSLGLLLISLFSYKKHKNKKLLFVSFVFLVLFIKGILMSAGLFSQDLAAVIPNSFFIGIFDLIILVLLFLATLKR
jgi:hypothetical protein